MYMRARACEFVRAHDGEGGKGAKHRGGVHRGDNYDAPIRFFEVRQCCCRDIDVGTCACCERTPAIR